MPPPVATPVPLDRPAEGRAAWNAVEPLPRLENGDVLTRDEFERRYAAMPHLKLVELIEGEVHVPSPVSVRHARPHGTIGTWLGDYAVATPGADLVDNATVRLDMDNEFQPDACLFIQPECGGAVELSPQGYIEGAPELVAEVAATSASIDLHAKLDVYRRTGVKEYIVWRVQDGALDWFVLEGGRYVALQPDGKGLLKSIVFPGLWLPVRALLQGDLKAVVETVRRGAETPEHAAFVRALKSKRAASATQRKARRREGEKAG